MTATTEDVNGIITHKLDIANGWINSMEAFHQLSNIITFNPVAMMVTNDACGEACDKFETQWLNLKKNNPGLVVVQIDSDVVPEAAEMLDVTSYPNF